MEEELIGGNKENYGKSVIKNLSEELTREFGKGYSERNLYAFVQFFKEFPEILQSLIAKSSLLSWTHYIRLMRVANPDARLWYHNQALEGRWSVATLNRSIDTRTEILIQNSFSRLMEGRTTFSVAHRLSTIENADTILVMRDGAVIEMGSHKELLDRKGFYYDLYKSQFA